MSHLIIIIGRQLGAGGQIVGRRLAEIFNAQFYDRELLNLAAKESGFSEKFIEQNDESKSFLKPLSHIRALQLLGLGLYNDEFSQESLFQFQSEAIRKAAESGPCVFVGRGADYVLRDYDNVYNIFLTAPLTDRVKRVMERLGYDEKKATSFLHRKERQRRDFYNFFTGRQWGVAENYDLCIDSSILGDEGTAQFIADFIRKGKQQQQP